MDRAEIERIARGLDAFRRSVLMSTGDAWQYHMPAAQVTRARNKFVADGLVEKNMLNGHSIYRRTDLGRAVADYLRESTDG